MRRIVPADCYLGLPCSVVSLGCAMKIEKTEALNGLFSSELHSDGYLSLASMNRLIRKYMMVARQVKFRRWERPIFRDFAHENFGRRIIVCVEGHFLYFDGRDYYSYFFNGGDHVVCAWYLE